MPIKSAEHFEIAYGEAGWNGVSSFIGTNSFGTLPNTSDEEQLWIVASGQNVKDALRIFSVPIIFVL